MSRSGSERRASSNRTFRCTRFESLEERRLLTAAPSLAEIDDVTVFAGAPLHVALDGFDADGDALSYTVSSTNAALQTAVLDGNRSMRMSVGGFGDMVFELFEGRAPRTTGRISELAEAGFYDGLTFHRVIKDFMIQGGDPLGTGTGGSGVDFDDEFHTELQHTSSGLLSMAKSSNDTNDSQFFITGGPTRWLDYEHSIFGLLTEGEDVRAAIDLVETDGSDRPMSPVVMDSVTVFVDTENGTLMLSAPEGTTVETDVTVTVTVDDGHGGTADRTFHVTIIPDTQDSNPYLLDIADIHTTADTAVAFALPGVDVEGDTMYFDGQTLYSNDDLLIDVDNATGLTTVTPTNGLVGVHGVFVGVRGEFGSSWDTQAVPVMISPAAPPEIQLLAGPGSNAVDGDGITDQTSELRFRVLGLSQGVEVTLFADGSPVGQAIASGDTAIVTTTPGVVFDEGAHSITAVQTLRDQEIFVGNRIGTIDLASTTSAPLQITVSSGSPVFSSAPVANATEDVLYQYDAQTDAETAGGVTYVLDVAPAGMTIDENTGQISWTPLSSQGGAQSVVIHAIDSSSNVGQQAFDIAVNTSPTLQPISDREILEELTLTFTAAAQDADGPLVFSLDAGAPAGATIHPDTGLFTWTPTPAQGPADYSITVRVTDATGLSSTQTVNVAVLDQLLIIVGDHVLLADTPGQEIQIFVTGGDDVQGLNLNVMVADGGPEVGGTIIGPTIEDVDVQTGTIFADNTTGQTSAPEPTEVPQWEGRTIVTASGTVSAEGLLATITIDTTGFTVGTWDLIVSETLGYKSDFAGIVPSVIDGRIIIERTGNTAPTAVDDDYTVAEGETLTVPADGVLTNDNDPDGNPISAVLVDQPDHGTLALDGNGSFVY
ncbi:MAG: peptidylprolyl isomerase, partial [Thermoguttaceae bacterium]